MNKLVRFIAVFAALAILGAAIISASAATYRLGDVDDNGEVEIIDATIIQRVLAYMVPETDEIDLRGDVDRNGELESVDATWIMRYNALIKVPYPIDEEFGDTDPTEAPEPTVAPTEAPEPTESPTEAPTQKPDPYELPPIPSN